MNEHFGESFHMVGFGAGPVGPVEALPVEAPPVEAPPVEAPPVEAPPVSPVAPVAPIKPVINPAVIEVVIPFSFSVINDKV